MRISDWSSDVCSSDLARAAPICRSSPSTACVDEAWAYGDADGDGRLVPGEATALRDALTGWAEWPGNSAGDDERALIFLGLSMMEATGDRKSKRLNSSH